ncbi:hypothetical protein PHAVU_010G039400 [Phaseolus vulgaris]|uniref:Uncharacterized protein n=1 Tax=Phaseolus vulgaris TaxID=3885 RepID=V7AM51_PHAVU|nr:hypothetical protein PHAVU_010G039400g [Phaseolus vulgaris]ESW06335.1 hypothetical protein PHAVU_010G039400g [Phaseolus vulgaris]
MEVELEPRVKALPFKKALHVLDTDLRTHWSTATNTKEWILLELDVSPSLSFFNAAQRFLQFSFSFYLCLKAVLSNQNQPSYSARPFKFVGVCLVNNDVGMVVSV